MTSKFPEHTNANYFLHTGFGIQGRPSMGAWVTYGLGSEAEDLPGFVVLNGGLIPPGGLDNFNSGFLPASYQGSVFGSQAPPVSNIQRREASTTLQRNKLDLLASLDSNELRQRGSDDAVESAIANYELAYRMQAVVPELTDLSTETAQTRELYGLDTKTKGTATFGRQCLLARRMIEKGVARRRHGLGSVSLQQILERPYADQVGRQLRPEIADPFSRYPAVQCDDIDDVL